MTASIERANYKVTFSVLVVGVTAYSLLQSLVIPALSTIQTVMHTNQNTVTWVVTAYLLSAAIFTPIMGRVGDIVGKEHVLVATLLALSIGSVVAGLAHSITVLIIGRVIQGIGGGVMPLSFGIIRDEFPREKLSGAIGAIAAMTAVGGGLGLVIAGPIINSLGFHWIFWIPLIMTLAAALCTYLFVPESPVRTKGRISWTSAVLLSAWLVALLLAVSEAPQWGWASAKVLGLLVTSSVVLVLWVWLENRASSPLVDMQMMRITSVWTTNLVSFLFGMGLYAAMAFLPEFLQTPTTSGYGFGYSTAVSGLFLVPLTAGMFVFGMYSGRIANRFGSKFAVVLGSAISCVGYFLLAFFHTNAVEILVVSALLGIGLGLAWSAMSNLIVQAVPMAQTGIASGMNSNIRTIGGAIGAGVMSSIITSTIVHEQIPTEVGYVHGFIFLGAATLVATLVALLIPREIPDHEQHMVHAELAIVAGGTITEG